MKTLKIKSTKKNKKNDPIAGSVLENKQYKRNLLQ